MKVLKPLIVLLTLSSSLLIAQDDTNLENYISNNKQKQFSYDYEKVDAESSILRDSWIAPLMLNYSYSKSNPYDNEQTQQSASLRLDQPIFQSGGIYYGIKFAKASKKYSDSLIDISKKKVVKDAISLLMQMKQIDLTIQKQHLRIANAEISLEQKKEQYLSGQLDSGFLDNAIIEKNLLIQALYDIQTNRERVISSFHTVSDIDYRDAKIPHLELLEEDEFLRNNIILSMSKSEIEKNRYKKDMTVAQYLPSISVVAGYNWSDSENQKFSPDTTAFSNRTDYYNYGFKASLPISINTFEDIEASRVDYLKSKLVQEDKKVQLKAIYEQVMQNISNIEKKIALSIENKELYTKLLEDTQSLYDSGYKTQFDIDLLSNSVKIQEIEFKIFEIDKQLELLTLYEMYNNEKI